MTLNKMTKEDLELLSYKDITYMILDEEGKMSTADLFKKITTLLELPSSVYEKKIADYYTTLTTDKRFLMLEDGNWDLRTKHKSDKIKFIPDTEDEEEEEEPENEEPMDEDEEDFDSQSNSDDEFDDGDDDLKDLVILDEEDIEEE